MARIYDNDCNMLCLASILVFLNAPFFEGAHFALKALAAPPGEVIEPVFKPPKAASRRTAGGSLKLLPVQFAGRVQPFDTFAQNTLRFVYGKTTFHKRPAVDVLMSWMLVPHYWQSTPFVQIKSAVLKKALKLNVQTQFFTPIALFENKIFAQELAELKTRLKQKDPLTNYFKALQKLEQQLAVYRNFQGGLLPGWFPNPSSKTWMSLAQQPENKSKNRFQKIVSVYIELVSASPQAFPQVKQKLKQLVQNFHPTGDSLTSAYKKQLSKIKWEVHYNTLNPFRLAWLCYLLGLLGLSALSLFRKTHQQHKWLLAPALVLTSGFLFHTYGIFLRSFIMERPPVTNMYETVIWVPWVVTALGLLFWIYQKFFFCFAAGAASAFLCLLLADTAPPSLLSSRLDPLEAVLNSNFWLATHVITITVSYGAFFLAFVLGDVCLYFFLTDSLKRRRAALPPRPLPPPARIKKYIHAIDRSIQIGVVLLAAGTILGGIWADYSWGRFWGWDPKETWALISLLGYLTLLHARLTGRVKEFGMAAFAVLNFFLIVFAWYGVNYVLGQGLHSYGFGSGGSAYIMLFALLHFAYTGLVWVQHRQYNKTPGSIKKT